MDRRSADQDPVYRISAAPVALSDDIDGRTRRYLVSMAVRTVCFVGGVVCWVVLDQIVLAWILLIGSLLLPYVAVVIANAGRERTPAPPTVTLHVDRTALPDADPGSPAP
jgi:hypothetical protein